MNDDFRRWDRIPSTALAAMGKSLKFYRQNFLALITLCTILLGPFLVPTKYLQNYLFSPPFQDFLDRHFGSFAESFFVSFLKLTLPFFIMAIGDAFFIATVIPNIVKGGNKNGMFFLRNIPEMFHKLGALTAVSALSQILICCGAIFLFVPGLFLMVGFSVVVPVLVIEKTGPIQAMKKSWAYTEGYRGKIFLILLGAGIISKIVWYVFMRIGFIIYTAAAVSHCPGEISIVPSLFGSIIASPIMPVTTVFLYLYVTNRNLVAGNIASNEADGDCENEE